MKVRLLSITLLLAFCASGVVWAQGAGDVSKGSVAVTVLDPSGAVIQGATVTLTGPTGSQTATTDLRGQAFFFNLVPNRYTVKIEFKGFRTFQGANVTVNPSQQTQIPVTLEPGVVTETVQVTENAAVVDTTSTAEQTNLTQETIANLPVQRNITDLFTLVPGAAPGGGTDNPGNPQPTLNPSISGSSGLENEYIIDGINATDQGFGAFGVWSSVYGSLGSGVNFDFVKQVQVKTAGFEAQYGQALGGVVNVVTNSGTNNLHGAFYGYGAPYWAEGTYAQPNAVRTASPQTELHGRRSYDIGANVGGPLIKDRLFWYGSFNPTWNTLQRMGPPNFGSRDYGLLDWKTRSYNWVGKLNFDLTQNHHLEGTAFGDPSRMPTGVHRSLVRDDLNAASSSTYGTRNWSVKYNGLVGASTVLNANFAWNHSYFVETPTTDLYQVRNYAAPKANSAYTLQGGVGFLENNDGNNKQLNFMLTHNSTFAGAHTFDLGYGFSDVTYDANRFYSGAQWTLPAAPGIDSANVGKTVFGGLFYLYPTRTVGGTTYNNVYRLVRGNYSNPVIGSRTRYHDAFAQDNWQINRYITAKLGVRWEEQKLRGNLTTYTFAGNWAPRLGFIIDPTGRRHTKIFGFWGRFYEKVPQDLAVRSMSQESGYLNGLFSALPPSQATLVSGPGARFSPYGTLPTVIYGGTKSQYEEQIAGGIEHQLPGGILVSGHFTWNNLNRIIEDMSGVTAEASLAGVDQQFVISNPSASLDIFHNNVPCTGGPDCNTDTGYTLSTGLVGPDGVADGFPDPRRVYKAMELSVEKRFANNWSVIANYRLAKLFGNYEGLFRNDNGQADPNITSLFDFLYSPLIGDQFKVGVLPTDRRHIVNLFANYLWHNLNVGLGFQSLSGTPLSKLLAHPVYGNAGEIPVGGRGAFGRSPWQNYFDTHLDYRIKLGNSETRSLRLGADLFNIFNHTTATSIDQDFELDGGVPNADFLKPLFDHRPFYGRFSVRFEF